MHVLILGGYGLVGSYVTARLMQAGHDVTGVTRDTEATRRFPRVRWIEGDLARMTAPAYWHPLLNGVDAVVNCAGALQENPRDSLAKVHVEAPAALYRACVEKGVRRVVHISAAGIDAADTAFAQTKLMAEQALAESGLDWVIVRPGLVLAPGAYGGTALIRGLAGFPFVTPLIDAERVVQVISVADVAETVTHALSPNALRRVRWDLVHPDRTTLSEIVREYRTWLGLPPARPLRVPPIVARASSVCADALAWLGWRSPLRTTSLKQLSAGVVADPTVWISQTAIMPRSLPQILSGWPSTVQDRWFSRLYFLKPLGIFLIAAFWIWSGLIALGPGFAPAESLLQAGGISGSLAAWVTTLGGLFDIALGVAVLFRAAMRTALIVMIVACVLYLLAGSLLLPVLWLDPVGVYAKVIPIMLALALLAAMADER